MRKIVFVFQIFRLSFVFLFWLLYVFLCNRWDREAFLCNRWDREARDTEERVKNEREKGWERKSHYFIQLVIILKMKNV